MTVRLSRVVWFRAHHRLADPAASAETNRARFGWTTEPHPHQYRCEVTVAGPVDEKAPMVMDLTTLDRILAEEVVAPLDGRHLHRDVPAFRDTLPTCEGIAVELFRRIAARLPAGVTLARVAVAEDTTLHAECLGSG
jgi:6-pyruvoyltetrahydropterin/6-carboxytetrahydropterin synthase